MIEFSKDLKSEKEQEWHHYLLQPETDDLSV